MKWTLSYDVTPHIASTLFRDKCCLTVEDLGWQYLNPRGSYFTVCSRDFPIQADVAPKVRNCSKTFMSKTIEGVQCSHTLGRTSIPFVIKVLEFLKPFSKGFKRSARQSLATLSPRPFNNLSHYRRRHNLSAVIRFSRV